MLRDLDGRRLLDAIELGDEFSCVPDDYVSGLDAAPPATGLFSAALPLR